MSLPWSPFRPSRPRVARLPLVGALALAVLAGGLASSGSPSVADAADRPSRIASVATGPGPQTGTVTVRWSSAGEHTDHYRIETGLTMFSKTDPSLDYDGRHKRVFTVPANRTSVTLTPAQVAETGATVASAQHLYFRVFAVNDTGSGEVVRAYPYLQAAQAKPLPARGSVPVRVANFNVRTVTHADTGSRAWTRRVGAVADTIVSRRPGIVTLQELSPGAVSGRAGDTRQTTSLLKALHARGGQSYALVRTTSYVRGGTVTGNQGVRIAYDTQKFRLVSRCADTTVVHGKRKPYNGSCRFGLPVRSGDPEKVSRSVAYAQLADRRTGRRFWVVSAHLYPRHSTVPFVLDSQERLRGRQAKDIVSRMDEINTEGLPIVFGGDINSWQNTTAYRPHNQLVHAGYYDTAAAVHRVNLQYATKNGFATTLRPTSQGFGARLDVVMVKGAKGATRFENVMQRVNAHRASDHNMVVADFRLPR